MLAFPYQGLYPGPLFRPPWWNPPDAWIWLPVQKDDAVMRPFVDKERELKSREIGFAGASFVPHCCSGGLWL
jgi:hypothetical protein